MKCPYCGYHDSKVIDSRPSPDESSIRRRRECLSCQKRFTTFESVEAAQVFVIKKDGSRELFDRRKLLNGILKACYKRPVDGDRIVSEIEAHLQNTLCTEISSGELGELAMDKLSLVDDVAYVRFASVYREFKDIDTFLSELEQLKQRAAAQKSEC